MENIYDTIIIGAGPGGMTAGIYAARREMRSLIIGREVGGQMVWASEIENYPGFKKIESFDLISKMQEQVKGLGVQMETTEVKRIEKTEDEIFNLHTGKDVYKSRSVIIAMGLSPKRLAIPGEEEFSGKGISYCVNCDGPFFKNKTVAIIGGGNSALDAAEVMSKIAKRVYLIHRRDEFRGFEDLVNMVKSQENIEVLLDSETKEIMGGPKQDANGKILDGGGAYVNKIRVLNNKTKEEKIFDVDGIFIEVGRIAHTDLVADLVDRNEKNQIIVDDHNMTKTPGLFAAGDVTAQSEFKQITIAMGQATVAALAAYQYLRTSGSKKTIWTK